MTYEQASVRGLVVRRLDETLLTFRDTVRHHFVASISTLETAAFNREKLLNDFYQYRVTAIEEGRKEPVKEYILPRGRDAGEKEYAAGTYVAPMARRTHDKGTCQRMTWTRISRFPIRRPLSSCQRRSAVIAVLPLHAAAVRHTQSPRLSPCRVV